MPALLDGYPKVRATFNLVPSLLAQIEDYGKDESVDLFLNLSSRDGGRAVAPRSASSSCAGCASRRERCGCSSRRATSSSRRAPLDAQFTTQDIRDLQVWFNLAWCDPVWVESDPRLSELKRKDRDFTEEDKTPLFEAQLEMHAAASSPSTASWRSADRPS